MSFSDRANAEGAVVNAITIDVEDWFHVLDARGAPDPARWSDLPSRLERNMDLLLEMLDDAGVRATMFWLGWAADRFPALVRRCHDAGHEIASHGQDHLLIYQAGRERFHADARRAKEGLEQTIGARVDGFRAPGFSVTPQTPWAHDVLAAIGHRYSSSIFPAARGHGGFAGAPIDAHPVETTTGSMLEFPITTVDVLGRRLCLFGGGYLRATPWPVLVRATDAVNARGRPIVYYVHPREVDPDQPRMRDLPWKRYLMYYVNVASTEAKLRRLLGEYAFAPLRERLPPD